MDDIRGMFLRQSLMDCEETFAAQVARPDTLSWDWLVVTAASEAQAEAYRAQIAQRLDEGLLPRQTRYEVIADPGGKRVGSGGATLNVMREIARAEGGDTPFESKRILVLHSGGDSQRIPQYSACGKLFSRVPRQLPDGRPSTLFDEFCIALSCVPARMNGGMLLLSGDVLLLFNALQIDLERMGAACLSIKAPVDVGTRHGVFLSDGNGGVQEFLHKQPETVLRDRGAVNAQGMVDIDTGAIWLDEARVMALYGLIGQDEGRFDAFVNETVRLNLYGDFVYPMSHGATMEGYLQEAAEGQMTDALLDCRRAVWHAIGGKGLSMIRLVPAEFIHFGTTQEWRRLLLESEARFGLLGWRRSVMSLGDMRGTAALNSIISGGASMGEGSTVEDSYIEPGAVIGKNCVLSGARFGGTLPDGMVLHVLPVNGGSAYCARTYDVSDNPKEAKRFGKPIAESLWTAKLHPVMPDMESAIRVALEGGQAQAYMSLQESFMAADMQQILAWQSHLTDDVRAHRVMEALTQDAHTADVLPMLSKGEAGRRQTALLSQYAEKADFPLRHRLYYALARATEDRDTALSQAYDDACWQAINDHLLEDAKRELAQLPPPRIVKEVAEVSLPVRVNWGGGWSDTPPYCLEHTSAVLNASLLLKGEKPVYAMAKRLDKPVIRIESDDFGVYREYTQLESLVTGNPHDPHALCKAALAVCGILPEDAQGPVAPYLEKLGGGILLRTAVNNVPKGSGLGTSSIVSAAVVRALSQLLGQPDDDERISSLTLCMEQLMNTGGGWQDQVGGLIQGIKLISSPPGTPQRLSWRCIDLSDEAYAELSERFALVFTGQRRMARNILREIMGKAVANHPQTMTVLAEIQRLAVLMAFELETGNIDGFAALLREHWLLSKRLDAGSTNACIDHMVAVCEDLIDGMMICGAGGGGFMMMIMKRGIPRDQLTERLESVFQESGVQVWDAQLER